MKKEKLIGATSIPYGNNCSIQVLNIKEITGTKHKKEERYYSDFYNVTDDWVYFIDRVELDPFCENLGYQLINNRLIIYSYDIVVGKEYHAVKKVFKYYDVFDNINVNSRVSEIITESGFDLPKEERKKLDFVEVKVRKLEEYIKDMRDTFDSNNVIPLIDISKKKRNYFNKKAYSSRMIMPILRENFTDYYTKMITGADKDIIVNSSVININDYLDSDSKKKIKKIDRDNQ